MKTKRIVGVFVFIVGIILILLSLYIRNQQEEARGKVSKGTSMMSGSSYGKAAGNMMSDIAEGKISSYDAAAKWSLIGGIVLAVIGGAVTVIGFTGSKRR